MEGKIEMKCGFSNHADSVLPLAKLPNQYTPGARFPVLTAGPSPCFCLLDTLKGRKWFSRDETSHTTLLTDSCGILSFAFSCVIGISFSQWFLCKILFKLIRCLRKVSYLKLVDYKFHKPSTHKVQPVAIF